MGDLISREFMKSIGGTCIAQRLKNGDLCPIISIDLLPSAEPEERTKERTETHACDCISMQAAIDAIERNACNTQRAIDAVKVLPSAESEIIRCKDCKNFRRWIDTDITFCDLTDGEVCEKDFCSRAERRTDE